VAKGILKNPSDRLTWPPDMYEELNIILWPDPRLKRVSEPVAVFDEKLAALAARMFVLMRENHGVGLAAPQVGQNVRLFVMNATQNPEDDRIYVNPELTDADGEEEDEEGCLSLPKIKAIIPRNRTMKIQAFDLQGKPFEQTETGYVARIWQHEFDHLNGTLILDRMGPSPRMLARKLLKDLEEQYLEEQAAKRGKK
jgi:peptide deformylase